MIYVKNLRSWERIARIVVFLAIALVPIVASVPVPWLWTLTGVSMALTGAIGWCPMCAMFGRRLEKAE